MATVWHRADGFDFDPRLLPLCEITFVIIRSCILNPTLIPCVKINSKRAGCHQ